MNKTAQSKRQTGRGWLNELREKANMSGSYLERFFKPELERIMGTLRSLDDQVRSELIGKQIGESSPIITQSAKDILKSARRNFSRREYISGVSDLGLFHKKMALIVAELGKWKVDVNRIHHRFLFEGVDDEKIKQLREHMEKKSAQYDQLIKEAGVMDFFYNLVHPRGRSLAAWEKNYPKETKNLRDGGSRLLEVADNLLTNTISFMKEMATARATRRPDNYMNAADKIIAEYNKFDSGDRGFRSYYQNAIMPFMAIKDKIDAERAAEAEAAKQQAATAPGQQPVEKAEMGYETAKPPATTAPAPATPAQPSPAQQKPAEQVAEESDIEGPPTERTVKSSFFHALESLSNEDPRILSGFISKYAKSIQGSDPETAIKLFSISKKLKG